MINLNELKQSNSYFETYVLSERFKVYKTSFQSPFTKESILKRIEENKALYPEGSVKNNHSLAFHLECPEFKYINNFHIKTLERITGRHIIKFSKFSWTYTQTKDFSVEWMDDHRDLHRFQKSHLNTQLVCVHYVSIPERMKEGEGNLILKTENNDLFSFTPKENDLLIFSGYLPHMTTPNQSSDTDRISYVSNFNFQLPEVWTV